MDPPVEFRLAHDLKDLSKHRSKDVAIEEDLTFEDLLLSPETNKGLARCGFQRPSPIQLTAIPLGRCGIDLVVQSKAGTGKTCIFSIVALEAYKSRAEHNFTQTIVISPTREIAVQTHEVICLLGSAYEDLRCALCIGGVEVKKDRESLSSTKCSATCQIVVGTPGRIKQLIELNILKTQLVELLVLDEADKLMDVQFKDQIDEIYKRLPIDKQMIAASATYPNELASFLQLYMRSPKSIRIGEELTLEALQEFYIECKAGHSSKKTFDNKLNSLRKLIEQIEFCKCVIFTNFQARAPIICDFLNSNKEFTEDYGQTTYICAELPQTQRSFVFSNFKKSDLKLLVSTDVSARGIDIQDIDLVVNLDLPADISTYYHRIGRAGRFGQPGKAVSFVSGETLDKNIFKKNIESEKINRLYLR